MTLTKHDVLSYFYNLLRYSTVATEVSGDVYYASQRPRDSRLEDITGGFVSGLTNQIQTGVVAVCIYVPDIDPYANGVMVENSERTAHIERVCQDWFDSIPNHGSDFVLRLQGAIDTLADEPTNHHFVSMMIHYSYFNE